MRHHLVILREPYLRLMLAGRKQIECRLSTVRRPPFQSVTAGDQLWLKMPSGPVRAMAIAGKCLFRELRRDVDLPDLLREYGGAICAEPGFFAGAASWAKFASLIWIDAVVAVRPITVFKSDQRAWVVLSDLLLPGMRIGAAEARAAPALTKR